MDDHRHRLIGQLVNTGHLSVPDRLALGSVQVYSSEIAAAVTRVLNATGSFPQHATPWQQGHVVHEGAMVLRASDGKIRLIQQRSHPVAPSVLADQITTEFANVQSAVEAFIRLEWPDNIDGIPVVWDFGRPK